MPTSLFDPSQRPHLSADQLAERLGVVKTTMANKAALINRTLVDACGDDEQLSGFLVAVDEALGHDGERARIVGVEVEVLAVDARSDCVTGLLARVRHDGTTYEVALTELGFAADSELGQVVAAYRRWQGRKPYIQPSS